MVNWGIKNPVSTGMFDCRDTVQTWPCQEHTISFTVISSPGSVQHEIWMRTDECRAFAQYLLQACDRVDRIEAARHERKLGV